MNRVHRSTRRHARGVVASVICMITLASFSAACGSAAEQADDGVASLGTTEPVTENSGDSTDDATDDATDGSTNGSTDGSTDGSQDDTDTSAPDDSTPDSVDPEDAFVEFTQCMRDNGIDMPDAQVVRSANGTGTVTGGGPMIAVNSVPEGGDGQPDPGFDPESEEFQEAAEVCQPILDAVVSDIEIDPEVEAEHREQMLDFAKCMRDHGIDFPDPVFNSDGGGMTVNIGSDDDDGSHAGPPPDSDAFEAANEECADVLGDDGVFSIGTPGTGD